MFRVILSNHVYTSLAVSVLFFHVLFIFWVVFGALLTGSRPVLRWFHIASLVWGILTGLLRWPCPLTVLENWLEGRAGIQPHREGFLLPYMDALVYPNISGTILTITSVIVCVLNLTIYGRQFWTERSRPDRVTFLKH